MLIDYVQCTGYEGRLWDSCTHFTHYYGCSHNDDIGVQCKPGKFGTTGLRGGEICFPSLIIYVDITFDSGSV